MRFMALLAWDENSSRYHGWFPGLAGARAEAATRDALEDALDEALRFSLRHSGGDTGDGRIDFWMFEISARPAKVLPGYNPEDLNAA
jgi:hypothetical protein